jgi:hypothetical protein
LVIRNIIPIFVTELKWKDLYCLQPREKMLKPSSVRLGLSKYSSLIQFIMFNLITKRTK